MRVYVDFYIDDNYILHLHSEAVDRCSESLLKQMLQNHEGVQLTLWKTEELFSVSF